MLLLAEDLKENRYLFHFHSCHDKDYILRSIPWNFKGHLLVLRVWPPDIGLDEIDFWVQLHSLPLSIVSPANIKLIGDHSGTILDIEPIPFGLACKKFVRIRVELDVLMPLKIGFLFPHDNKPLTHIIFKYEKLSDFCFHCGCLDHMISSCCVVNTHFDVSYGSDLQTDPQDSRIFSQSVSALQYFSSSFIHIFSLSFPNTRDETHPNLVLPKFSRTIV